MSKSTATPPQTPQSAAEFRVFYWNIYGRYPGKAGYSTPTSDGTAPWTERMDGQAQLIMGAGCSIGVLLEAHQEKDKRTGLPAYRGLTDKFGANIKVFGPVTGGNLLWYDADKFVPIGHPIVKGGGIRTWTKWNIAHKESGVPFWIAGAHAPANDKGREGAAGTASRAVFGASVVAGLAGIARGILCIDRNSSTLSTKSKGYLRSVLNRAGWVDLPAKQPKSADVGKSSRHGHNNTGTLEKGEPIESIHTARLVDVIDWHMIPSGPLSDHNAFVAHVRVAAGKLFS